MRKSIFEVSFESGLVKWLSLARGGKKSGLEFTTVGKK